MIVKYVVQMLTRRDEWCDTSYAPEDDRAKAERLEAACFDPAKSRVIKRTVIDEPADTESTFIAQWKRSDGRWAEDAEQQGGTDLASASEFAGRLRGAEARYEARIVLRVDTVIE